MVLAGAALLAASVSASAAEKRVALVIGNATYVHVAGPRTAINDARLIARTLRDIGFAEVFEFFDLDRAAMITALEAFAIRTATADWALIYYAGHGVEVAGTSYVVPTNAKLASAADLAGETLTLARLLAKPGALKLRMVILDMPRANPFAGTRPPPTREKEPASQGDELVAFATQVGNVLMQNTGENGFFAIALARHMATPGADIVGVFDRVRLDVMTATDARQVVWTSATLSGSHRFVQ